MTLRTELEPVAGFPADADKIRQVVSNILSNAVKFSSKGAITVTLLQKESEVLCSIADEGCGIAPKNLSRVFERFYQENPTAKGSGLGLAIAKGWVDAHGGRVWTESEGEGTGTRISFTLPR